MYMYMYVCICICICSRVKTWSKNETAAQRESFGLDIRRTSTRISRRTSGGKNFGQALEILEKQTFRCGRPWPERGADVHDPSRGGSTKLQAEKLRAECSFPNMLRWAKSCESYRRIASEISPRFESLAFVGSNTSPPPKKTQKLVLIGSAFVVPQFEARDWRSFVQRSFYVELRNGLRELTAFAER